MKYVLLFLVVSVALSACDKKKPDTATQPSKTSQKQPSIQPVGLRSPASLLMQSKELQQKKATQIGTITLADNNTLPVLSAYTSLCHEGILIQAVTTEERHGKSKPVTFSFLLPVTALPQDAPLTVEEPIHSEPRKFTVTPSPFSIVSQQPPLKLALDTAPSSQQSPVPTPYLGSVGCFHTGSLELTAGNTALLSASSVFAYYNQTHEVYHLTLEVTDNVAISVLLYKPFHLLNLNSPYVFDLNKAFKDPENTTIRAFVKTRTILPDQTFLWESTPIKEGSLSLTFSKSKQKPVVQLSIEGLSLPLPDIPDALTLRASAHVLQDAKTTLIPSPKTK